MSLQDELTKELEQLEKLSGGIATVTQMTEELNKQLSSWRSNLKEKQNQDNATIKSAKLVGDYEKAYKEALSKSANLIRARVKISADLTKEIERQDKASKSLVQRFAEASGGGKKLMSSVVGVSSAMGLVIPTMKNVIEITGKYRIELAELSRMNTVMGRSMESYNRSLQTVKKTTTLSTMEFTELNNSVIKNFRGLPPTSGALAKMAGVFNDQLGPGIENARKGMDLFTKMQEKFPPMASGLKHLTDLVAKRNEQTGDTKGLDREIKQQKELLMILASAEGMSVEDIDHIAKLGSETSDTTKDTQKFTEAQQKMKQASEDMMIVMGNHIAPLLSTFAKGLASVIQWGEKFIGWLVVGISTLQSFGVGIGTILRPLGKLVAGLKSGTSFVGAFATAMAKLKGGITALSSGLGVVSGLFKGIGGSLKILSGLFGTLAGVTKAFSGTFLKALGPIGFKLLAIRKLVGLAFNFSKYYDKAREDGDGIATSLGKGLLAGLAKLGAPIKGLLMGTWKGIKTLSLEEGVKEFERVKGEVDDAVDGMFKADTVDNSIDKQANSLRNVILQVQASERQYKAVVDINNQNLNLIKQQVELLKSLSTLSFKADLSVDTENMEMAIRNSAEAAQQYIRGAASGGLRDMLTSLGVNMENITRESADEIIDGFLRGEANNEFGNVLAESLRNIRLEGGRLQQQLNELEAEGLNEGLSETEEHKDKIAKKQAEIERNSQSQRALDQQINTIHEARNTYMEKDVKMAEVRKIAISGQAEQALAINNAIRSRIDAEAQVMAQAQFGLGVSVKMMQKQVNLAHENLEIQKGALANYDNEIEKVMETEAAFSGIEGTERRRLQNKLKTAESEREIKEALMESGVEQDKVQETANQLIPLMLEKEKISQGIAEEQSKIYELTKSVREGYLDAIREMSTGAGEFEKIIGRQDMGVTQLMRTVKDATGENRLNTMQLGFMGEGLSSPGLRFTNQGVQGDADWNKVNRQIFGYEESVERASRADVDSRVGGAVAASSSQVGAAREAGRVPERSEALTTERREEQHNRMINMPSEGSFGNFEKLMGHGERLTRWITDLSDKDKITGENATPHMMGAASVGEPKNNFAAELANRIANSLSELNTQEKSTSTKKETIEIEVSIKNDARDILVANLKPGSRFGA